MEIRFSKLVEQFAAPPNALYIERDRLRNAGRAVTDLISGNLNRHGLLFPQEVLEDVLQKAARAKTAYDPHPLGQPAAREGIAAFYRRAGVTFQPEHIVLTPGTSLSYAYLFRALAEAGDEILCPQPSYPLFESIAAFSGVRLVGYRLKRERARWAIDFESLERAVTERSRAIVLISPHNPTGHVASSDEIRSVNALAVRHELPIISDEVFSPFVFNGTPLARPAAEDTALVITLNGFSKLLALPGVKMGWMGVSGPESLLEKLMRTLEHISDAFLPVNEIMQQAVAGLLERSEDFQKTLRETVEERFRETLELLRRSNRWRFAEPEGGFYIALELPAGADEESFCLRVLREHGLLIHPGYFYDFESPQVVFSFVSEVEELRRCVPLLEKALD